MIKWHKTFGITIEFHLRHNCERTKTLPPKSTMFS
jgi:hypothetical protein